MTRGAPRQPGLLLAGRLGALLLGGLIEVTRPVAASAEETLPE